MNLNNAIFCSIIPFKSRIYNIQKDLRDSSPKPPWDLLDSIRPNCYEYLPVSQARISADHLSRASQLNICAMLKNPQQCSFFGCLFVTHFMSFPHILQHKLSNAQQCSVYAVLSFSITHCFFIALQHYLYLENLALAGIVGVNSMFSLVY